MILTSWSNSSSFAYLSAGVNQTIYAFIRNKNGLVSMYDFPVTVKKFNGTLNATNQLDRIEEVLESGDLDATLNLILVFSSLL